MYIVCIFHLYAGDDISMGKIELIEQLNERPSYKNKLFCRGWIISNIRFPSNEEFPFYNNFAEYSLGTFYIRVHKDQHYYVYKNENKTYVLIGNCVNPFQKEYLEKNIICELAKRDGYNRQSLIEYLNELTGNFFFCIIQDSKIEFITDCAGMMFACYGTVEGKFFISSHAQLIADIANVKKSDYVERFEKYKYFYKYGLFFPGDTTQFENINRVLQNHIMYFDGSEVTYNRFYPVKEIEVVNNEEDYVGLCKEVVKVLNNTMYCISKKYSKPAISLTGGMDSKTTLACAYGLYDQYSYYSYITMSGDKVDADAAKEIANQIGIEHKTYTVSEKDEDFEDLDIIRKILYHNNGEYRINDNDVRKRAYFDKINDRDVEIKSWVSEVARSNYYKKFGIKMPKRLTPRNMTSMFKIFITQRKLAKETDKIFDKFIEKTGFHNMPSGYDESDMYLWEFRYSAWGGMVITSEHSYSDEIFIPFNNRNLLELMLRAPQEKRISDQFHDDLIKIANHKIYDTGITITNWNETKTRMRIERAYFLLSSLFSKL